MIRLEKSEALHRKIRKDHPIDLAIPTWDLICEAIKTGTTDEALELLDYTRVVESQINNDSFVSFAEAALTYLAAKAGEAAKAAAEPAKATPQTDEVMTLKSMLATTEQNLKATQGMLRKANEEIKTKSDIRAEIDGLKETQKILAAMLQERQVVPEANLEDLPQGKKQDYLKLFEEAQKRVEAKRQQDRVQADLMETVRQLQGRTETLGLKETDPAYIEIQELVETGRLRTAEAKLKKLESEKEQKSVKQETPEKETDDQIFLRVARAKGLLKSDTPVPAGGNLNATEVRKLYASGKITSEQRDEKLKAIGVSPLV